MESTASGASWVSSTETARPSEKRMAKARSFSWICGSLIRRTAEPPPMYRAFLSTRSTLTTRTMPAPRRDQVAAPMDHSGARYCIAVAVGIENFTSLWSAERLLKRPIRPKKPSLSIKKNRLQTRSCPSSRASFRKKV